MEDDHYYTRDTVQKMLKQRLVIKRASTESRVTPEIHINEKYHGGAATKEVAETSQVSNAWPLLVLRNDFAQQMQSKVCKEYLLRTYRHFHAPEVSIEDRVKKAKPKVDTGLSPA